MKVADTEREQSLAPDTEHAGGNGDRPRGPAPQRRWALRVVMLAIVAGAAVWAWTANSGRAAMDMNMRVATGDTPFPVVLAPVQRGPVSGSVTYTGSVAAFNEEDIFPRVTGRIVDMPVYPGDAVRAGQVVARLDTLELTSRVREAEGGLAAARAGRAQMEADLVAARQGVVQMEKELAMAEAEATYARGVAARSERLVAVGAIARQEYENDRSMALSAEAKREAAVAKLEQARAMETSARRKLDAANSMVAQSQAMLGTATIVRDYVNIVSPTSGYVVKRLMAPGILVQPGMAILKIAQIDKVRLQANVGEKDLATIRVGAPVEVTPTTSGGAPITARVTSIFPFVDPGARTAVVEAIVDNPGHRLVTGQYVTMRFVTGDRGDALSVPADAVVRLGGRASVWVADKGRVASRAIVTGVENADRVEVKDGLREGETVVVRGQDGRYAGARVADASGAPAPAGHQHGATAAPPATGDMPGMKAAPPAATPPAMDGMPGMGQTSGHPSPDASTGHQGGTHGGH